MNLSNTHVTDNELCLLAYGKEFAVPPVDKVKSMHSTLLADLAVGIRNDQRLNTQRVRSLVNLVVEDLNSYSSTQNYRAFVNLRKRLKQDDLAIVKADKGEALALIERSAYIHRVYEFLNSSNAVEQKSFSIEIFNKSVRSAIASSSIVVPPAMKKELYAMCYSVLRLYGQLKTHKDNFPIRLFVACYTLSLIHISEPTRPY